jgi:DNA-binding NarL/FixJ family response regulator
MLEGLRNARKHARATLVRIDASESARPLLITIADDGVGFPPAADPPWTIASHVADTGGRLSFQRERSGLPANRDTQRSFPAEPIAFDIADDHALFRQGLRSLLALEGLEVVAEVEQASGLEAALAANPCDILLLDLQMEQWLMDQIAEISRKTTIIVLTANESVEAGLTALRLGARAIVHKRFAIESLMTAIRGVADGLVWMPPAMQAALVAQDSPAAKKLSARESEIVRYVAIGMRNVEVAARLSLSESTVKTHLTNIFQKLGIRDRIELTRYAIKTGVVTVHDQ